MTAGFADAAFGPPVSFGLENHESTAATSAPTQPACADGVGEPGLVLSGRGLLRAELTCRRERVVPTVDKPAPEFAGLITPDDVALILLARGAQALQQLLCVYACNRAAGLRTHLAVIRDTDSALQDARRALWAAIEGAVAQIELDPGVARPADHDIGVFGDELRDVSLGLVVLAGLYEGDDVIDLGLVIAVVDAGDLIAAAAIAGWQCVDGEAAFGIATGLELDNGLGHARALFLRAQCCPPQMQKPPEGGVTA